MTEATSIMAGKRGLIMGIANERSLAWGIAKSIRQHGGDLAITHQGGPLEKRVRPLAEQVGAEIVEPADVSDPASLDALFETIGKQWGRLDFAVHAIGFTDKIALRGRYLEV